MNDEMFNIKARHSFEGLASYNSGYEVGVTDTIKCINKLYKEVYNHLEPGWKTAFGKDLIFELLESIYEDGCLDSFQVTEVKEKYGQLDIDIYNCNDCTYNVLEKYRNLSQYICAFCGEPARYVSKGWVYPICQNCIELIDGKYEPIEKAYNLDSYNTVLSNIDNIKNNM